VYFNDVISANQFTQSIGLPGATIAPSISGVRYLNDPSFFPKIGRFLRIDDPHELVAKCNVVSQVICEVIRQEVGCNAYLTVGDVTFSGEPFFNINQGYVRQLIAGGKRSLNPQHYHHHAWLTLDSMEVIDFTLNTSMALLAKDLSPDIREKMLGGVMSGHGDEFRLGVQYHPVLIGEEFYLEYDAAYPMLKEMYIAVLEGKPASDSTRFIPVSGKGYAPR
jgi:hypothetical protein